MTPHTPRKRFGQHFLHDRYVIQRIIDEIMAGDPVPIVEIGPGAGALTIPLLQTTGRLTAIEIDRDLAASLTEVCRGVGDLKLHVADALKFDFTSLAASGKIRLIGNLPYNISTPLLFHLLKNLHSVECMLFMMQKEVVDRICAEPGSGDYGRLTVMVQSQCRVERLFNIAPGSFTPPPKVESSFIRMTPIAAGQNNINDPALFAQVVKQAFSQRRKTIRNSLKGLVDERMLVGAGIDAGVRAENLSVADYKLLVNFIHDTHRQTD